MPFMNRLLKVPLTLILASAVTILRLLMLASFVVGITLRSRPLLQVPLRPTISSNMVEAGHLMALLCQACSILSMLPVVTAVMA